MIGFRVNSQILGNAQESSKSIIAFSQVLLRLFQFNLSSAIGQSINQCLLKHDILSWKIVFLGVVWKKKNTKKHLLY